MSKKTVHVTIFDETYSLVTDEQEEHLSKAALMVDQQMQEIAQAGFTDTRKIAVLVALQLASKLLGETKISQECKEKHSTVTQWLKEQDEALSDFI
jgi:cell division protein ZapA (FtsZ GTPase activity inhibitor)